MSERVYLGLVRSLSGLLEAARRSSARAVNAVMTATYWEIGRRIVEFEQGGEKRAEYGKALLRRLSGDLTRRFGRGFSVDNLESMRRFYRAFPQSDIPETVSRKSRGAVAGADPSAEIRKTLSGESSSEPPSAGIVQTLSAQSGLPKPGSFPLPWSHYVLLLSRSRSPEAVAFYHAEALRGGWSLRQLDRTAPERVYRAFRQLTALLGRHDEVRTCLGHIQEVREANPCAHELASYLSGLSVRIQPDVFRELVALAARHIARSIGKRVFAASPNVAARLINACDVAIRLDPPWFKDCAR